MNDTEKYPHMLYVDNFISFFYLYYWSETNKSKLYYFRSVKNCFIRGSVVRYVQLPGEEVDTQLLQDAARKEAVTSTR